MQIRSIDDGSRLVTSDVKGLRLYDVRSQVRLLAELEEPSKLPYFDKNPAGERLAVAPGLIARSVTPIGGKGHWTSAATSVGIYDDKTLERRAWLETQVRLDHETLALSADGSQLASVHRGSGAVVFDAATGKKRWELPGEIASGVSWSPNGRWLAVGDTGQGGGCLNLIDSEKPEKLPLPKPKRGSGLNDSPFHSVFSADGGRVAFTTASWGTAGVVVYDVATRTELCSASFPLGGDEEAESWLAPELAFAADEGIIVVGQKEVIRAFRIADGKALEPLRMDNADDLYFAVAGDRIWITVDSQPTALPIPDAWA